MATRDTALATEDLTSFSDGDNLHSSANWDNIHPATGNIVIETSGTVPVAQGSGGQSAPESMMKARWVGAGTFDNDHWANTAFYTSWQSTSFANGVTVRQSADTDASEDCWFALVHHDAAANLTTVLGKIVDGTLTTVHSAAVAWADTDEIGLDVEGATPNITLTVTKNGTAIGGSFTATGQSGPDSGQPGIISAGARTNGDAGQYHWSAGNFTGGGASVGRGRLVGGKLAGGNLVGARH